MNKVCRIHFRQLMEKGLYYQHNASKRTPFNFQIWSWHVDSALLWENWMLLLVVNETQGHAVPSAGVWLPRAHEVFVGYRSLQLLTSTDVHSVPPLLARTLSLHPPIILNSSEGPTHCSMSKFTYWKWNFFFLKWVFTYGACKLTDSVEDLASAIVLEEGRRENLEARSADGGDEQWESALLAALSHIPWKNKLWPSYLHVHAVGTETISWFHFLYPGSGRDRIMNRERFGISAGDLPPSGSIECRGGHSSVTTPILLYDWSELTSSCIVIRFLWLF